MIVLLQITALVGVNFWIIQRIKTKNNKKKYIYFFDALLRCGGPAHFVHRLAAAFRAPQLIGLFRFPVRLSGVRRKERKEVFVKEEMCFSGSNRVQLI